MFILSKNAIWTTAVRAISVRQTSLCRNICHSSPAAEGPSAVFTALHLGVEPQTNNTWPEQWTPQSLRWICKTSKILCLGQAYRRAGVCKHLWGMSVPIKSGTVCPVGQGRWFWSQMAALRSLRNTLWENGQHFQINTWQKKSEDYSRKK